MTLFRRVGFLAVVAVLFGLMSAVQGARRDAALARALDLGFGR